MSLTPASGSNGIAAGERAAASMVGRDLSDRSRLSWNPTTGNILLTGQLLQMPGTAERGIELSWRYNSINDHRPTLSGGTEETALKVGSDDRITYTADDGGTYTFVPKSGGGWTMPRGLNASVTSFSSTTVTLRFNDTGYENIYQKVDSVFRLVQAGDHYSGTRKIDYNYDTGGRLASINGAAGRVINFNYEDSDNSSQPSEIIDASLGREIDIDYGDQGRMERITDAAGAETRFEYNSAGLIGNITDGRGGETILDYGTSGKAYQLTFGSGTADASTETHTYTSTTATRTDGNNHQRVYRFNADKQVTGVTDANGNITTKSFDAHDNLLSNLDALGNLSTAVYNPTNTLAKATAPAGATGGEGQEVSNTYPSLTGDDLREYRPTSSTDPQGNATTFTYDTATDRLYQTFTTDARGGTLVNRYHDDAGEARCGGLKGQLCETIDGKGSSTTYTYDANYNLATIDRPYPFRQVTNTYDAAGRVASSTDGKNQTEFYSYDGNDRITQIRHGSTCSPATCVTFAYDGNGNLIQRVDAAGTTAYAYDAQNRPTSKTIGGVSTSLSYDDASNITGFTDPTGTVDYRYDNADRLTALAEPGGYCPATPVFPNTTKCTGFVNDDNNRRTVTKYPNGVKNTTRFDKAGRTTSITTTQSDGTIIKKRAYTHTVGATGKDGSLRESMTTETGATTSYTYTSVNRLIKAITGGTTEEWKYDRNGNRTQVLKTGKATIYAEYNEANKLCWTDNSSTGTCTSPPAGATEYTYDENGNTTGAGTTTSSYNVFDQLTATTVGGATTDFDYAGANNTERTSAGNMDFLNGSLGITRQVDNGKATSFIRDPEGTLISMRNSDGSFYYTMDALGSVLTMTDNNQNKAASYNYDSWGNIASSSGTQETNNPWRYAGGYYDAATKLTKFGARYYDPTLGRFTQPDPSGQEANPYLYAQACPTNFTDPTGLASDACNASRAGLALGILGIIGSAASIPVTGPVGVGAIIGITTSIAGGALGGASAVLEC